MVTACDTSFDPDVCDSDDEDVDIVGTPSIEVIKTANVSEVTAPGGPVTFTVHVDNTGDVPVTIDSLTDSVFGNITTTGHDDITATTCSLGQTIAVNGNYECTFTATITGNPGDTHTNMVTACDTSFDPDVCDSDDEDVDIVGTPTISVTKTADVSEITAPSGSVVFTVLIENTGNVPVTIDSLTDSVFGNITTTGHDDITATTCSLGQTIAVNDNYECTFTATITGNPGDTHTNMVTACDTSFDPDVCDSDDEDVDIVGTPTISVTKTANVSEITAPVGP
ncbi:MAG: hypothetical protein R3C44_21445 [Chloroflexota bacterium]